jgi:tRNA(fMet)-specific endonuclease VapC
MILVDTDILIDFFRGHTGCRDWMARLGAQPIAISVVTAMELYVGCGDKAEQQQVRQKLSPYRMLWPDEHMARGIVPVFAEAYLASGTEILDALIAATALSHQLKLHTFNLKHFAPFPGLKLVQPYKR